MSQLKGIQQQFSHRAITVTIATGRTYIQKNDQFVREFAEDTWNGDVKISPLEGTYLQWIDFRRLELDAEKLRQKMLYQAHVAMDEGSMFGPEGNGFERLNLAAPRNLIEEIMDRIAAVLR